MNRTLFRAALIVAVAFGLFVTAPAQHPILGGYKTKPKDDALAKQAAEFAVSKRSETHPEQEGLRLNAVNKAETQVVAGMNYRLCITVSLGSNAQDVSAVVYRDLKSVFSLTSWAVVATCGGAKTEGSLRVVPRCTGQQLSLVEVDGDADIGGKRYGNFVFTNVSKQRCRLSGFPELALLNRSGVVMRSIGVEYSNNYPNGLSEEDGKRIAIVNLDPGQKAWFQIYYNDGMALDHKRPFPTASKVRVTAPYDKHLFVLKTSIQSCCGVQVSSIREGEPNK